MPVPRRLASHLALVRPWLLQPCAGLCCHVRVLLPCDTVCCCQRPPACLPACLAACQRTPALLPACLPQAPAVEESCEPYVVENQSRVRQDARPLRAGMVPPHILQVRYTPTLAGTDTQGGGVFLSQGRNLIRLLQVADYVQCWQEMVQEWVLKLRCVRPWCSMRSSVLPC